MNKSNENAIVLTGNEGGGAKAKFFRKTTQPVAPGTHTAADGRFNIYPARSLGGACIDAGFDALARRLATHSRVILDGMGGVMWDQFRRNLEGALQAIGLKYEWININDALRGEKELEEMLAPSLGGNDPLFGKRSTLALDDYFIHDKLAVLRKRAASGERTILYGAGASLASPDGFLVYADVPKNEIQFRSRAASIGNLGCTRPVSDAKAAYKRFYFADWPVLRSHLAALLPRLDLVVDSQRPDDPAIIGGNELRTGLGQCARSWIRARPWFEPGPWGGQWMKQNFGLSSEAPNLAWSFELISPENGIAFESNGHLLEVSFDFLMAQESRAVLGEFEPRFGTEFPIRFDYLDTFGGGNLSLQCHPRPEMAWREFGERCTQDETYYLTDCAPDAEVFLGFQSGVTPSDFERALRASHHEARPLDVKKFVQTHLSQKHGLYLIPNGTIHCSGRNNLVLEISATPYIFTFKMYDWMRMDLDGRPRPLNIERAMASLYFDRQGDRIPREFLSRPYAVSGGPDWQLIHLPTHAEHFYDVHRFDFSRTVQAFTDGSPHVLNLVEGSSVLLEIEGQPPQRFAFGETFVIPAAAESYRLRSETGEALKVVKAFLKPEAKAVPDYFAAG